ncbi:uncharacterized protein LAESUDRAFT_473101 [Laetiporus sulphureus 93-53]|uniref:F-box domain-containing protein n=1 Tax=Laetiporus sulphureus 93-53 TaxID=1314785 RepID=A0A165GBS3_9APHY|nr:uncharacterized protein LAESUDRAFT_473101 [Laetiporus sulphureus 93-53]KZT10125.1 hypothetical protein LAESUDRAFT_473101 [Laetiporus sulphureus 93-53]
MSSIGTYAEDDFTWRQRWQTGNLVRKDPSQALPVLPPEVWEHIIKMESGDNKTLKACAHVCRSWYFESRITSFAHLLCRNQADVRCYVNLLKSPRAHLPSLRERTRSLCIEPQYPSRCSILSTAVTELAGELPRLDSISIRYTDWQPSEMHKDAFAPLSRLSSVTQLHLYRVKFPSINVFHRLISALPRLTGLECCLVSVGGVSSYHSACKSSVSLKRLHIDEKSYEIIPSMTSTRMLDALEVAELEGDRTMMSQLHAWQTQRLLSSAGGSLLELQIEADAGSAVEEAVRHDIGVALKANSKLQKLRLRLKTWHLDAVYLRWLNAMLATITSNQLRQITVLLMGRSEKPLAGKQSIETYALRIDSVDIFSQPATSSQLDDLLSSKQFEALAEVDFQLQDFSLGWKDLQPLGQRLSSRIVSQYPKLHKRGVLRTSVIDYYGNVLTL